MTNHHEIIEMIRGRIPKMVCLPGCTACCAHVPWSKVEWDALPEMVRASHTIHSMKCPFLTDDGCGCYQDRAFTCRIFGVAEGMECPRGATADRLLTPTEASDLSRLYVSLFTED